MTLVEEPIDQLTQQLQDLQKAGASIGRVSELLALRTAVTGGDTPLSDGPLALDFRDVSFTYAPEDPQARGVLSGVTFHLPAGQTVGLLGRTGSGKTTLTRLISRLYDATSGEITLGGVNITHTPLKELRRRVAVVTQDVQLFQASVRENLSFFDPTVTDAQVEAALHEVGGYIGLELAEALRARGLSVVLLERGPEVAGRMLDPQLQGQVRAELERGGVDVRCGVTVQGLTGSGRVTGVQTDAGLVRADLVVVAVGVKPNVDLARAAGVRLGKTGAVAVNARQETNVPGVYSAGDNTESLHRVTRRRVHIPLGLPANRMGRVAGVNMAGGDARFPGVVGTGIFRAFELGVARTGLTQTEAQALGLDAVSVDVTSTDHAGYHDSSKPIHVRLTGEKGTGRLLGAQLVGHNHLSVKRVDVVAALLGQRGTAQDLFDADLAYAPPFSGVWDVLLVAADRLHKLV
ncbi:FAD-dependent oxidoreductase [Deinococcus sp. 12RED42]|uniref:FAD-dependent oxidoreductase n=1 Tax=Deinococcus sp. 12RED42 TaxID=2745872 RepID=UPI00351D4603